jgi:uncharacterized protein
MPHQCVKCSRIILAGSKEIIEGCRDCGGKFFFYIRDDQLERIRNKPILEIPEKEREMIEKEVREIAGVVDDDTPVILDLESIRSIAPGKYEIDVVNLFNKKRPLIYKLEEGKYLIDLASTLKMSAKDLKNEKE